MKYISVGTQNLSMVGIGTWGLGEGSATQDTEQIEAIHFGLDNGINVIDTAEMYGDGQAEIIVGRALKNYDRSKIFVISKFYPWHATLNKMEDAVKGSLKRLQMDYLDLYLIHWQGNTPMKETLKGAQKLIDDGLIRNFGISNFDTDATIDALETHGGKLVKANEVLYNLSERGIEFDLLPEMQRRGVLPIGYSPYGSGNGRTIRLPRELVAMSKEKGISEHQLVLAWAIRRHNLISIPKASTVAHMQENVAVSEIEFTVDELALINRLYPRPTHKTSLGVI